MKTHPMISLRKKKHPPRKNAKPSICRVPGPWTINQYSGQQTQDRYVAEQTPGRPRTHRAVSRLEGSVTPAARHFCCAATGTARTTTFLVSMLFAVFFFCLVFFFSIQTRVERPQLLGYRTTSRDSRCRGCAHPVPRIGRAG